MAGELHRDAARWTWTRVTLLTADMSTTGECLPTIGVAGWKVTCLTASHLEKKQKGCVHVLLYSYFYIELHTHTHTHTRKSYMYV